jgi:lysophospholipase L1-like esterase
VLLKLLLEIWYEWEVRGLERGFKSTGSATIRPIVFYGSSSIRLWSSLAADLGDPRIVNLGFGGSTLAACSHFFERLVVPRQPASLVVYAGDNDFGLGRTELQVFESFRELMGKVDAQLGPIPFAFLSIKPSPARWSMTDAIRSANSRIRQALDSRPNSLYIDIFEPMLGPNGRPRPELYIADGLHLSPEGYKLWTEQILRHRDTIF